jgi:hypothetical protein
MYSERWRGAAYVVKMGSPAVPAALGESRPAAKKKKGSSVATGG